MASEVRSHPPVRVRALLREGGGAVFAAVFLLCRDRTVTEDATQEAFARAFERWDRLAAVPWAGGWVTTTAMNVARRSLRRRVAGLRSQRPSDIDATVELW